MRKSLWSLTLMLPGGLAVNFGGYQVNIGLVNSTAPLRWISRLISPNLCRNKWRQPGARYGRLCLHNGVFKIYNGFFRTLMSCTCFDKSCWSGRTLGLGLLGFSGHVYRLCPRLFGLLRELVENLAVEKLCTLCLVHRLWQLGSAQTPLPFYIKIFAAEILIVLLFFFFCKVDIF